MEQGVKPRGRIKITRHAVAENARKSLQLNDEDALVRGKCRRLIYGI